MSTCEHTASDLMDEVFPFRDRDVEYHSKLKESRKSWYCYLPDAGHSILCVLGQHFESDAASVHDIINQIVPVPVKTVQKAECQKVPIDGLASDIIVVSGLDYCQHVGLVVDPDDVEFVGGLGATFPGSIWIKNDGPRIASTNYWGSSLEESGRFYISPNAGDIRILIPTNFNLGEIGALRRTVGHAVVTYGNLKASPGQMGYEVLFEDHSTNPYCLHTSEEGVERPIKIDDQKHTLSVWYKTKAARPPRRLFQTDCYLRQAPQIPYLKSWEDDPGNFTSNATTSTDSTEAAANDEKSPSGGPSTGSATGNGFEFLYTTANTGHTARCSRKERDLKIARRFLANPDCIRPAEHV